MPITNVEQPRSRAERRSLRIQEKTVRSLADATALLGDSVVDDIYKTAEAAGDADKYPTMSDFVGYAPEQPLDRTGKRLLRRLQSTDHYLGREGLQNAFRIHLMLHGSEQQETPSEETVEVPLAAQV